jgi:copper transport protein
MFVSFIMIALFMLGGEKAWGHSFVIEEYPAPGSLLEQSPEEVKITFNSGVENDFSIRIFDEELKEVTVGEENISSDRKAVSAQLLPLEKGQYTVEYYVISSNDGHPVQGSFSFMLENDDPSLREEPMQDGEAAIPIIEEGGSNKILPPEEEPASSVNSLQLSELFIYMMRVIYYAGLVLVIGWVFWWRVVQSYADDLLKKYALWGTSFQLLHLVGLLSLLLTQLMIFTENGLAFGADFPFDTTFGAVWLFSLLLSLIGLVFLFKNRWFDCLWLIGLVVSKSMNGHSVEFEPVSMLVAANSIHLLSAGIWAAGLTFIVIFWRRQGMYVRQFMPLFSKIALLSIVMLSITGIFTTVMFLPNFEALFSGWGYFLLLKAGLVIAVIVLASIIRSKYNNDKAAEAEKMVKADFLLMLLIVIVVAVLTYLNPLS